TRAHAAPRSRRLAPGRGSRARSISIGSFPPPAATTEQRLIGDAQAEIRRKTRAPQGCKNTSRGVQQPQRRQEASVGTDKWNSRLGARCGGGCEAPKQMPRRSIQEGGAMRSKTMAAALAAVASLVALVSAGS